MPCAHHGPGHLAESRSGPSSLVATQPTLTERLLWARPRARMGGRIQPESSSPVVRAQPQRPRCQPARNQTGRGRRHYLLGGSGSREGVGGPGGRGQCQEVSQKKGLKGWGWASHGEGPQRQRYERLQGRESTCLWGQAGGPGGDWGELQASVLARLPPGRGGGLPRGGGGFCLSFLFSK